MAARISPQRRALIAAVHTAAKDKGLDEDTRRDKIAVVTGGRVTDGVVVGGKRSSSDCTDAELRKVLDAINGASLPSGRKPATTPVAKKARALWMSLYALGLVDSPSESALRAWVKRQYKVDDLAFIRPSDGFAVVEGLKKWAQRAGVNWAENKDPRRCIITAQWTRLRAAGIPEIELSTEVYNSAGVVSVALSTTPQLDKMINVLGARLRALPKGEGR